MPKKPGPHSRTQARSQASFTDDVPRDVQAVIHSFLDIASRFRLSQVSRSWADALKHPLIWHTVVLNDFVVTDAILGKLVRLWQEENCHCCPHSLKIKSVTYITANGLLQLQALQGLRELSFSSSQERHCHALEQVFAALQALVKLEICNCDLVGFNWPVMPHLRTCFLQGCQIAGMEGLDRQPAMQDLQLGNGGVGGGVALPQTLTRLTCRWFAAARAAMAAAVAALANLKKLRTDVIAEITQAAYPDPLAFVGLEALKSEMFSAPVTDEVMGKLAQLRHLRRLDIQCGIQHMEGVRSLCALTGLTKLYLTGRYKPAQVQFSIQDEHILLVSQSLLGVRSLRLYNLPAITENALQHIAAMPALTELTVRACNRIRRLAPLAACRQLRSLVFWTQSYTRMADQDVEALSDIRTLDTLSVECAVSEHGMRRLTTLSKLKHLRVEPNGQPDAALPPSAFSLLPSLTHLERAKLPPCSDLSAALELWSQTSSLRSLTVGHRLSERQAQLLRSRLPYLEELCEYNPSKLR